MPMMAAAASKAQGQLDPVTRVACKQRANCLKLKEIRKTVTANRGAILTCGVA
jgi:hypothetical protein